MPRYFFVPEAWFSVTQATSGTNLLRQKSFPEKKTSEASRMDQPTIDGKPAPAGPKLKPKPTLRQEGGNQRAIFRESERLRQEDYRFSDHYQAKHKHRTPQQERAWQEMNRLLEWHGSCPGSQAFPPADGESDEPIFDEKKDDRRYKYKMPKSTPKNHYDE